MVSTGRYGSVQGKTGKVTVQGQCFGRFNAEAHECQACDPTIREHCKKSTSCCETCAHLTKYCIDCDDNSQWTPRGCMSVDNEVLECS